MSTRMTTTKPARRASLPAHIPAFLWQPTQAELTTTRFMRNRTLFETLAKTVLPKLRSEQNRPLKILFWACSTGCEPYTLKLLLGPDCADEITGIDFDASAIECARLGVYSSDTWTDFSSGQLLLTAQERNELFEPVPAQGVPASAGPARVRDIYRNNMTFLCGDLFAAEPSVPEGTWDAVICNNLLLHLQPQSAEAAWAYLLRYVADHGALVVAGCNPNVRTIAAKNHGLEPGPTNLKEIHAGWAGVSGAWNQTPRPAWAYPEPREEDPDFAYLASEIFFTSNAGSQPQQHIYMNPTTNRDSRPRARNFVISGTSFWNPGDDFVRDGVIAVLRRVFPNERLNFHFYNFNPDRFPKANVAGIGNEMGAGEIEQFRGFIDGVIIAGLSAGHEVKELYRWILANGLENRVFMIGAGYESPYCAEHIVQEPETSIFRRVNIITGRTHKHPPYIEQVRAPFVRLNCPALLSVKNIKEIPPGKKIERIGFSIQLPHETGILNQSTGKGVSELNLQILFDLAKKYEVEVIAHHKTEYFHFLHLLKDTGIPVLYSSFYQELHEIYPRYDLVITTRLHSSLFANGHGIPGIIINDTDRHTLTLEGFQHSVWVNSRETFDREFERVSRLDLAAVAAELKQFKETLTARYVEALSPVFSRVLSAGNSAEKTVKRLLWTRTDSIGDAVLASSMLPHIAEKHPSAKIAVLCEQRVADLYLACPHVASVIAFDRSKSKDDAHLREIISEIAQFNPDLVLNSVRSRDLLSETLTLAHRAANHIAIESDSANIGEADRAEASRMYTRMIPSPEKEKPELDRHRDFLAGLGIKVEKLEPKVWTARDEETLAEAFFKENKLEPKRTIALFPGAQHEYRIYDRYADALKGSTGYDFLVFGTVAEEPMTAYLKQRLTGRVFNLCGRSTLRETAALLRRCRLYVGAESAGAHMACALGVPNVVVLGGGHFGRFMPYSPLTSAVMLPLDCYGCNWQCRHSSVHCIKDISADVLAAAIQETLAKTSPKPCLFLQPAAKWPTETGRPAWQRPDKLLNGLDVEIIEVGSVDSNVATPGLEVSETPLITAIVSTYNSERFMRACLEDLEAQTIARQMEILIIDSGSEQNERAIVHEFQQRYSNIRYVRTERETLYASWNRAITLARGKYIANTNTDDSRRGDALEILSKGLEAHPEAGLAYGNYGMTNKANDTFPSQNVYQEVLHDPYHPSQVLFYCPTGCLQFWRKSTLEQLKGFDPAYKCVGDYEILIRFMRAGLKPLFVPEFLSLFYINQQGLSFGSGTAANEDQETKARYRKLVTAAEIFNVDPSDPNALATAWIALGNMATSIRVPWSNIPHRIEDYAVYCYQKALQSDPEHPGAWHNTAVLTERLGITEHLIKTLGEKKRDLDKVVAKAKKEPHLVQFSLKAKVEGVIFDRGLPKEKLVQDGSCNLSHTASSTSPGSLSANGSQNCCAVAWEGTFLDFGSLSQVNRELTRPLLQDKNFKITRVCQQMPTPSAARSKEIQELAAGISPRSPEDAQITVRHSWPPNWRAPHRGQLVVIQPWEYGSLPQDWVRDSEQVAEFWLPSEYARNVYISSGVPADKIRVVPNGVNLEVFHPAVRPINLPTKKSFKFLFVGGTIHRKGPDLLLRAYLENFTAKDDVCLVIKDFGGQSIYAGQTFEGQIRAAQAKLAAPEILYLNEEMPPESVPALYRACNCFVLPYRGEGFGMPVLEAMACGLPVIVTAGGATDDFVRDEFGWRVPAERKIFGQEISGMKLVRPGWLLEPDVNALGEHMRSAASRPEDCRERGRLASEHARANCTWQKSAAIAAERIRALAARAPAQPQPKPAAKTAAIVLPACAKIAHLAEARELFRQKKLQPAWEATLAALARRSFHPEAYQLLAEIALAAGDSQSARLCADHARRLAPGWKPAKQLKIHSKHSSHPAWLVLPDVFSKNHASRITHHASRLSICLITKNEERFLSQCLASVRGLASQIVIVDTGSTDRTVEVAKQYGAEVYHFDWCDDFSAARNAALEHATGDWVLLLDADEELSPEGKETLQRELTDPTVIAWRLPMVDVGREAEGLSYVPRLFRNAPGLFYIGRVHEQVFSSIEVRRAEWGLENRIGATKLIHHGYTAEVTRDRNKIERNLRLLEKVIEEFPGEPHLLMNLGLELSRSGRESDALQRYREAFDALSSKPATEVVPELRETLLTQFCTRLVAQKQFQNVVQVLTSPLARAQGGLTASLHFSLGLACMELAQLAEAAKQFQACLAKRGQPSLSPINKDIATAAPHHCLAMCLAKMGNVAAAEKAFQAGLNETGHADALRLDYAKFLVEQSRPVDALHRLHAIVTENSRHAAAWRFGAQIALSDPEFFEVAGDWTQEAIRYLPDDAVLLAQRAEVLLLKQECDAARKLWQQIWKTDPQPRVAAALLVCDLCLDNELRLPETPLEPAAMERAFLAWYRKLLTYRAHQLLCAIHHRIIDLQRVLPQSAKMIGAALSQAEHSEAPTPEPCTV
jgi:ADP-heptose:LPS heptosyltransferase/glycosyltransferase involved in cell wall biosynthesis/chemotaxis methyl-accepting protein methylase/Tfp pilus assembly protein PilF